MSGDLAPADLIGGRYRLIELVGSGAMGSVWAADNELTRRRFALKIMKPEAALDPTAVQRFLQEARAAGGLRHPSIVEVYDVGHCQLGGKGGTRVPFIVMQLLEGETFEALLVRQGRLPEQELLALLYPIAQGLAVAHDAGIVHRDLKPANLFFQGEGARRTPIILDFGISKLLGLGASDGVMTVAGLVLGSPPYMSPEQAGGKLDVDARTDIWALGVIAYRALSGQLPFAAPNYNALMLEIIGAAPRPITELCLELNPGLAALVMQCLSKAREQRPRDARAFSRLLEPLLDGHAETGMGHARDAAVVGPPRRVALWLGLGTVAAAAGLAIALGSTPRAVSPTQPPQAGGQVSPSQPAPPASLALPPVVPPPVAVPSFTAAAAPSARGQARPQSSSKRAPARHSPARVQAPSAARSLAPPPVNEGIITPGL